MKKEAAKGMEKVGKKVEKWSGLNF